MTEQKVRLILPKGSLNTIGRGDTEEMFRKAGYDIKGYTPGKESMDIRIANDKDIECEIARPQTALKEFKKGIGDVAILGSDWVREGQLLYKVELVKVADLGYGDVKLVAAMKNGEKSVDELLRQQQPINIWTEYLGITQEYIMQNPTYQSLFGNATPIRDGKGLVSGENGQVVINLSDGETERFIRKNLADLVVDNTQSGDTLRKFGLTIIDTLMESQAGIYATPEALNDPFKADKIEELSTQLRGVAKARSVYLVKMNVPSSKVEGVISYLIENELCAKTPDMTRNDDGSASIWTQMPREKWIDASRDLRRGYGVDDINKFEPSQVIGR